jgi:hypothetical protein
VGQVDARLVCPVCREVSGAMAERHLADRRLTSALMNPVLGAPFRSRVTDAAPQRDSQVPSACGSTVY